MYPQSMFLAKIRKNIKIFPVKISIFTTKKILYIAWACFHNDLRFFPFDTSAPHEDRLIERSLQMVSYYNRPTLGQ